MFNQEMRLLNQISGCVVYVTTLFLGLSSVFVCVVLSLFSLIHFIANYGERRLNMYGLLSIIGYSFYQRLPGMRVSGSSFDSFQCVFP